MSPWLWSTSSFHSCTRRPVGFLHKEESLQVHLKSFKDDVTLTLSSVKATLWVFLIITTTTLFCSYSEPVWLKWGEALLIIENSPNDPWLSLSLCLPHLKLIDYLFILDDVWKQLQTIFRAPNSKEAWGISLLRECRNNNYRLIFCFFGNCPDHGGI